MEVYVDEKQKLDCIKSTRLKTWLRQGGMSILRFNDRRIAKVVIGVMNNNGCDCDDCNWVMQAVLGVDVERGWPIAMYVPGVGFDDEVSFCRFFRTMLNTFKQLRGVKERI